MLFCKTTTLITAVPSHDTNHGSIITISLSTKMITTSYRFTLLQHSKSQKSIFKYTGNCCSISHTLTCLLHKLKTHYHVQRSFPHLPIIFIAVSTHSPIPCHCETHSTCDLYIRSWGICFFLCKNLSSWFKLYK